MSEGVKSFIGLAQVNVGVGRERPTLGAKQLINNQPALPFQVHLFFFVFFKRGQS